MDAYNSYISEIKRDNYNADIVDDEGVEWTDDEGNVIDYNTPNWWMY